MKTAFFNLFLWMPLAIFASQSAARPLFVPPPLSGFDGKKWGPLQLGQTTFKEIRPQFETGEGLLPQSTELTQTKTSPMRVDLLWRKQEGKEVLGAIAIKFKEAGAAQSDLLRAFAGGEATVENGEEVLPGGVEALYQEGRFEQWRVLRFPDRGVAAFQTKVGETTQTQMLLFTSKEGLGTLSQGLSSEYSPPVERIDPHAGKPKIAEFGNIAATIDLASELGISRSQRRDWENSFERRMRAASAEGALEFRFGAGGSYSLDFDVTRNNRGGSISAKAVLSGSGPYGPISVSGSGYGSWKRDEDREDWNRIGKALESAGQTALQTAEREFARQMRASGPPPLEVVRWSEWEKLVDGARNVGTLAPIVF